MSGFFFQNQKIFYSEGMRRTIDNRTISKSNKKPLFELWTENKALKALSISFIFLTKKLIFYQKWPSSVRNFTVTSTYELLFLIKPFLNVYCDSVIGIINLTKNKNIWNSNKNNIIQIKSRKQNNNE